jgi:hypothetical protein
MGGEQRVGRDCLAQGLGGGPGERQTVKGACASTDFVEQHQAVGRGVVQDIGGFGHLDHKGGAATGQVIGGANAGENPVDRPKPRRLGRHEAADMRHECQ